MRHLALFTILSLAPLARAEVRVWQGTLTLPTYEEGAPDPNPPFDAWSTGRFNYPYTLRERLTDHPVPHAWRAVFIENEYLKCSVLPDIGGHLYTCIDKLSGQPMFYANPSIKKADIGYRGAWAAFGIEFNFPVSHNWVSMSPVPFSYAKNPDGSASITVGNKDRVYGMEWRVELRLHPASTILEEHVTLSNPSEVRHRYYWWNNAAIEVKDDSRICYPMRYTASHGFTDIDTWPVDSSGKDLSIIRNQTDGPVSRFAHGTREPFMGVWRPDTNTGTVHYAEYAELPAKKIWSWGVDADGLDWRRALSDNNSAYVEVQAGLYRNQETYAFLEPGHTIAFTEYWMPVRGIGGIARANLSGVLNLDRRDGTLVGAFNANRKIVSASLRILQDKQAVFEDKATLTPEQPWKHEIQNAAGAPYTFELRDAAGKMLLRQTEGEYDWTPTAEIHTGPQPKPAVDDPLQRGTDQELQGDLLGALRTYTSANPPLNAAAGRLCVTLQRYAEAIRYLEPAADAESAYYLRLAHEGVGVGRLSGAGSQPAAAPAAAFLAADPYRLLDVAAQYMRRGQYQPALDLLSRDYPAAPADQSEPGSVLPQKHPLVAYYRGYCRAKLGQSSKADYAAASKLSTLYVFPSSATDLEVLRAASAANPDDSTAHYLLGTQLFARGLTTEALTEWNQARYAGAAIPVLHADIGFAMLRERHDSIGAWKVFLEGLKVDALNEKLYEGLDESLSLMGRPARELAVSLEHYPDLPHMPAELVYALILDRAEAQEFDGALALFHDRFFPRQEGGTNVRQVWVEVNALHALVEASAGKCSEALAVVDGIAAPVAGLPFTKDGLAPFVDDARTQYLFGQIDARCDRQDRAMERWRRVAAAAGRADLVWAWGAARKLEGYDNAAWTKRIEAAAAQPASPYVSGVLEAILGKQTAAWKHYQQAILTPDRMMSHHLTRMAMAGTGLPQ